jgi:hypothetical protein
MTYQFILLLYQPRSDRRLMLRRTADEPWRDVHPGRVLQVGQTRLRVIGVRRVRNFGEHLVTHTLHVFTRRESLQHAPTNVVAMPCGRRSAVADYLRFQALVGAWGGDVDRWLRHLIDKGDFESADVRFVRWIRGKARRDPKFLDDIRRMVATTPLWSRAPA